MKAVCKGNQYQITYRVKNYDGVINEYFPTLEEAELRIAQIRLEKKRNTLTPPSRYVDADSNLNIYREIITVEMLMKEFIDLYGMNHWSEGTLSCNLHRINHYILPYIGDVRLKDLTTHRLESFYRNLHDEPAVKMKGRETENNVISYSVIEKVHALMRSAFNQAIRWDYYQGANPALAVELPRWKKQSRATWDDEEARTALRVCEDPILKLCIYLALGCSMRIGEILGLTWDCVHIEQDKVNIDEAYLSVNKELRRSNKACISELRSHGRADDIFFEFPELKASISTTVLVLKHPKTESSIRDIYLPKTVAEELCTARDRQQELKLLLGDEYKDYNLVIAQDNGRPYEPRLIGKMFDSMIKTHDLRPVVFHSLRHSSTSLKLRISGGDIKAVQGDTGHAQSNMVTDVYSHIMNDDRKHLAHKMDDQFFRVNDQSEAKTSDDPTVQSLIQLISASPELASSLLQMTQILGKK